MKYYDLIFFAGLLMVLACLYIISTLIGLFATGIVCMVLGTWLSQTEEPQEDVTEK